jgi:hypothetical protein
LYPYLVADMLGLNPLELEQIDRATAECFMGYAEGKRLAEWVAAQELRNPDHGSGPA